ncbi:MAG: hypothetical protein ACTHKR_07510 [Sphingomonas sp.]
MTETVDTLEASFGQVTMAAPVVRPVLAGGREPSGAAFEGFLRSGTSVEMKAFTGVSGDSGGYAVRRCCRRRRSILAYKCWRVAMRRSAG